MPQDNHDTFPVIIEDIHIEPEKDSNNYACRNFKVFPDGKETAGGHVFGLIEIKATPTIEAEKIVAVLQNTLTEAYYQQIVSSPTPQKLHIETIFEYALNKTNQTLLEMIEIGHIHLVKENIHFLLGIVKPTDHQTTDLYFTNHGTITGLVLHRTQKNNYKIINIIQPAPDSPDGNERLKLFSDITSGEIGEKDTFIATTEAFANFISPQKMTHILINNPFQHAIEYFKAQIRQNLPTSMSLSAIFIKRENSTPSSDKDVAQHSLTQFISTTETTEKLLTPTFSLNLRRNIRGWFERLTSRSSSPSPTESLAPTTTHTPQSPFKNFLHRVAHIGKSALLLIRGKRPTPFTSMSDSASQHPGTTSSARFRIPKLAIVAIILVLAAGIGGGIYTVKTRAAAKEAADQYASQVSRVRSLISDAEVSIIYKNKNKGLAQLQTATTELSYLPQASAVQRTNYDELQAQIKELKNKILNIEKVVPSLFAELTVNGQPRPATTIVSTPTTVVALGTNKTIITLDAQTGIIKETIDTPEQITMATVDADGSMLVVSDTQNVYTLGAGALIALKPALATAPTALQVYNANVYSLHRDTQQILKYKKSSGALTTGSSWIKTMGNASLVNATSIAVDGSIYVLQNDGTIHKFYAGENQSFASPTYEPVLTAATRLITNVDMPNMYIVEPATKRLIVMNKSGVIGKQIIFDSLDVVTDITISPDGKKAYILSGTKLYQTAL